MQNLKDFDTAIFEAASEIIGRGVQHHPLVILMMTDPKQQWKIIDVSEAMADEAGKDMIALLIDMLSKRSDVACVAFVSEAWMVMEPKQSATGEMPRPSEHPDREECVVVSFSIANGRRALSVHPIRRSAGAAASLERGELRTEEEIGAVLDGRFFAERRGTIH